MKHLMRKRSRLFAISVLGVVLTLTCLFFGFSVKNTSVYAADTVSLNDLFTVAGDDNQTAGLTTLTGTTSGGAATSHTGFYVNSTDHVAGNAAAHKYSATKINGVFNLPDSGDLTAYTDVKFMLNLPEMTSIGGSPYGEAGDRWFMAGIIRLADATNGSSFIDVCLLLNKAEGSVNLIAGAVYTPAEYADYPSVTFWSDFIRYNPEPTTGSWNFINGSVSAASYFIKTGCVNYEDSATLRIKRDDKGVLSLYIVSPTDFTGHGAGERRIVPLDGKYGTDNAFGMPAEEDVFGSGKYMISFFSQSTDRKRLTKLSDYKVPTGYSYRGANCYCWYSPIMIESLSYYENGAAYTTAFNADTLNVPAWHTAYEDIINVSNDIVYVYDADIVTSNENPLKVSVKAGAVTLADPTVKAGYRFDGWYNTADFTGSRVTQVSYSAAAPDNTQTFYAKVVKIYEITPVAYEQFYLIGSAFNVLPTAYTDKSDNSVKSVAKIEIIDKSDSTVLATFTDMSNISGYNFPREGYYVIKYTAEEGSTADGNEYETEIFAANTIFDNSKLFEVSDGKITFDSTYTYGGASVKGLLMSSSASSYAMRLNGKFSVNDTTTVKFKTPPYSVDVNNKQVLKLKIFNGSNEFSIIITERVGWQMLIVAYKTQDKDASGKDIILRRSFNGDNVIVTENYTPNSGYAYIGKPGDFQKYLQTITLKTVDGVFGVYATRVINATSGATEEKCFAKFDGTYDVNATNYGASGITSYGLPTIASVLGSENYSIEFTSYTDTKDPLGEVISGSVGRRGCICTDAYIAEINGYSLKDRYTTDSPDFYKAYIAGKMILDYDIPHVTSNANPAMTESGAVTLDSALVTLESGYLLEGFYYDADYQTPITEPIPFAGGTTVKVYGKVVKNTYTATLLVDGAVWKTISFDVETDALIEVPTKDGYLFMGWKNGNDTIVKIVGSQMMDNLELAAQFIVTPIKDTDTATVAQGTYAFPSVEFADVEFTVSYALTKGGVAITLDGGATGYAFTEAGDYVLTTTVTIGELVQNFTTAITVTGETNGSINGFNVTLTDGVICNFYVTLNSGYTAPSVKVLFKGVEYEITDYTTTASRFKFSLDGVVAIPELADEMNIYVYAENGGTRSIVCSLENYSVKKYLETLLNSASSSAQLKTLVVDLLNLSANFMDYKGMTGPKANADLTEDQKALATAFALPDNKPYNLVKGDSATFVRAGVYFGETINVGILFKTTDVNALKVKVTVGGVSKEGVVVRYNGTDVSLGEGETAYEIRLTGIMPYSFDSEISVAIVDVNNESVNLGGSLTYSVNTYVERICKVGSEGAGVNLAKALWCYGTSATAYYSSING